MGSAAAERLRDELGEVLGPGGLLVEPEDLWAYGFDAYSDVRVPTAAALPRSAEEVAAVVRAARACGEPVVARGAGTGLCGAAVPVNGGLVISFARMNRIIAIDPRNRRALVQPGVANLALSVAAARYGLFFGPDPSSQKISTLGGNAATNAGGPHAFAYGSMSPHVLGLEFVDVDGRIRRTALDDGGYDLCGLLVGSEGTLGIITALELRLLKLPRSQRVCVAAFREIEAASEAVSAIVSASSGGAEAIGATALEIMDQTIVRAVEAHYHAGYPLEAGAVLLIELAGDPDDTAAGERAAARLARDGGALSWRSAASVAEREALWAARKGAAGALGRIAPNYYIQDATVPRTRLAQAVRAVERIATRHALTVGNVFHAGDGNLHPLLVFDRRDPAAVAAVANAGTEILEECIGLGGTISGEHGIGYEKRESLRALFSEDDLDAMRRLRDVFDPAHRFNPDKIFPSGAVCAEVTAPA